jgi:hypothetical protein
LTTQLICGGYEGKFSVITDQRDNTKKVARINLEQYGYVPQDPHLHNMLRALSAGDIPATSAPVVDLGGGYKTTAQGSAVLDKVIQQTHPENLKAKARPADVLNTARAGKRMNLQEFSDFRAQIQNFAKSQQDSQTQAGQ